MNEQFENNLGKDSEKEPSENNDAIISQIREKIENIRAKKQEAKK